MARSEEHSMTLTVLATAVVRSETIYEVIRSLQLMKSDPEQADYLDNIADALDMLDIVASNNTYRLKDDPEEPEVDD